MKGVRQVSVLPIPGEAFVYEVSSRSEDIPHRVDMTQAGGRGVCTCMQFQTRVVKTRRILEGEHVPYIEGSSGKPLNANSATECRHIFHARQLVYELFTIPLLDACRDGMPSSVRRGLQLILVGESAPSAG